jgi:hypothetical protein
MSPHAMASAILAFSYFDLAFPVAVLVFIIVGVLRIHFRQGRSKVLEHLDCAGKVQTNLFV